MYKQGRPALDDMGNCCYRTKEGLMCAVGCLIPDEMYDSHMEGKSILPLIKMYPVPEYVLNSKAILDDLQTVHDNWENVSAYPTFEMIESKLKSVARKHGLVYGGVRNAISK